MFLSRGELGEGLARRARDVSNIGVILRGVAALYSFPFFLIREPLVSPFKLMRLAQTSLTLALGFFKGEPLLDTFWRIGPFWGEKKLGRKKKTLNL